MTHEPDYLRRARRRARHAEGANGRAQPIRQADRDGGAYEDYPGDHLLPLPGEEPDRGPEPYQPFPVDALPPPLGEYVRQAAMALGCDPAYVALPVLAVAASAIGNTRVIRLKRTWEEPCVIWTAIIGDSGTLKSPAWQLAVAHLFHVQGTLLKAYQTEDAAYQEELKRFKEAKRDGALDTGAIPPAKPILRRVICSDTTVEKLATILEDNPHGTLLARDELAGWLASFTRYKGRGGGSDLPNWLEMHRAGPVMVDRKTSEKQTLHIPRAAVSVTGGIQPSILARALTADFLEAGLGARLLMAMPPKVPKRWSDLEIDPDTEQAYRALLDRLLMLDLDTHDGERVPHVLSLDVDAQSAWVAFYNEWAKEQAATGGELAAAYAKLEAYAVRFALVHHVGGEIAAGEDDRCPIGVASVHAGIVLCRWFAGEARRIYATVGESTEERDRRRLVEFIRARGGRITTRELQNSNTRKYANAEQARSALNGLVNAELARWVEGEAPTGGGHRTAFLELLPTHNTSYTRPPEGNGRK